MAVSVVLFPTFQRHGSGIVAFGAQLGDLAMQMYYILRTRTLMQVIYILRDNARTRDGGLQFGNGEVRCIRLGC